MTVAQISKKFKLRKDYVVASLNNVSEKTKFSAGDVVKLPFREGELVNSSNNLYADLFEKPRREVLKRNSRAYRAKRYAAARKKPNRYYTVKKGETLFTVAQKHGISVKRLIASNADLIKKSKKVNAGVKLVIK